MDKLISKVIQLSVVAMAMHTTFALASPGILASRNIGANWEIFLIDPITGDAKNLTNNPRDD